MKARTFIFAILLGIIGAIILDGMLNIPDGGSVVAIAYIGSEIVGVLLDEKRK